MPVAYLDDLDFDTSGGTGLFCNSLGQAACEFDTVKFWNLANVPGLRAFCSGQTRRSAEGCE